MDASPLPSPRHSPQAPSPQTPANLQGGADNFGKNSSASSSEGLTAKKKRKNKSDKQAAKAVKQAAQAAKQIPVEPALSLISQSASSKRSEPSDTSVKSRETTVCLSDGSKEYQKEYPALGDAGGESSRQKLLQSLREKRRQRFSHQKQDRTDYEENMTRIQLLNKGLRELPMVYSEQVVTNTEDLCLNPEDQSVLERCLVLSDEFEAFQDAGHDRQVQAYSIGQAKTKKSGSARYAVQKVSSIYDSREMKLGMQFPRFLMALGNIYPLAIKSMKAGENKDKATALIELSIRVGMKAWLHIFRLGERKNDIALSDGVKADGRHKNA